MALIILRCAFLVVAVGLSVSLLKFLPGEPLTPILALGGVLLLAIGVIAVDMFTPRKRLETITAVYFGLLVGLILTYVIGIALTPLVENSDYRQVSQLLLGLILCYTCISVLIQTKDDFRFIIPYVEFAKEVKGLKPYILDTSVVIDGRIADVIETKILDNQLIVPRFVVAELQNIADSSDKLRRSRGRRGSPASARATRTRSAPG